MQHKQEIIFREPVSNDRVKRPHKAASLNDATHQKASGIANAKTENRHRARACLIDYLNHNCTGQIFCPILLTRLHRGQQHPSTTICAARNDPRIRHPNPRQIPWSSFRRIQTNCAPAGGAQLFPSIASRRRQPAGFRARQMIRHLGLGGEVDKKTAACERAIGAPRINTPCTFVAVYRARAYHVQIRGILVKSGGKQGDLVVGTHDPPVHKVLSCSHTQSSRTYSPLLRTLLSYVLSSLSVYNINPH